MRSVGHAMSVLKAGKVFPQSFEALLDASVLPLLPLSIANRRGQAHKTLGDKTQEIGKRQTTSPVIACNHNQQAT